MSPTIRVTLEIFIEFIMNRKLALYNLKKSSIFRLDFPMMRAKISKVSYRRISVGSHPDLETLFT